MLIKDTGQESATQAVVAPVPSQGPLRARDRRVWLVAVPLALIVTYAFTPILANGFVAWDDDHNFLANPYFRGLGAAQVKWAWTTFWLGVYQPLAWLLFETQYVFCELDPRGYHLTSVLFHVANAVVLYVLTVTLLARCRSDHCLESPWTCSLSAGLATALFAVHPLRVEAVAWVSAQMYLPCILFFMLAVLAYLRAFSTSSSPRRGWLVGSFLLFVTALLFHALPVSLPAVLLILDAYPVRRFTDDTGRWFGASARRALLEKVPFVMVSLVFMGLAITARPRSDFPIHLDDASVGIARACYAIWFYIEKTVLPLNLIAGYPIPGDLNSRALPFSLCILATLAISAGLFLLRRRWPGLLAAWLGYLVILAPNSGLIRFSDQIAADRYSYMAMLGLVTVAAAGFCRLFGMLSRRRPYAAIGIIAIPLGVLLGLTALTRNQCRTWLNSETLWAHALTHGPKSSELAHYNLGVALQVQGRYQAARGHFTEVLRLNPGHADAHVNLGLVLNSYGKYEEAVAHFTEALRLNPSHADAHNILGLFLSLRGKYEAAAAHFAEALRLDPSHADARNNLGTVFAIQKRYADAETYFAEAVRLQPDYASAYDSLGNARFRLGNYKAARADFAEAIRLDPRDAGACNAIAIIMATCPEAKFRDGKRAVEFATRACELTGWKNSQTLSTLAAAQAEAGEYGAAVSAQQKGLELATGELEKEDCRSRLALYQAKRPYREPSPQPAPPKASP